MRKVTISSSTEETLGIFPSRLGWMAAIFRGEKLVRLRFGHPSAAAAQFGMRRFIAAFGRETPTASNDPKLGLISGMAKSGDESPHSKMVRCLQAYAAGRRDTLTDIPVDLGQLSDFQRHVFTACRGIPYGRTISYAELAARAGFPGAARAVGNCMAANPIPLVVPCHRVVRSDGRLGAYSAPGGTEMKRRLLEFESKN